MATPFLAPVFFVPAFLEAPFEEVPLGDVFLAGLVIFLPLLAGDLDFGLSGEGEGDGEGEEGATTGAGVVSAAFLGVVVLLVVGFLAVVFLVAGLLAGD